MVTIAFAGLGVMGKSMATNLYNAGFKLKVHTRTVSKAQDLIDKGVKHFSNPVELVQDADYLITMLGYPSDVENFYFGNGKLKNSVFTNMKKGAILIDMTTSEAALAKKIYDEAKKYSMSSLDAPVSGGDIGARDATLAIMVGGDEKAFNNCLPILEKMGKSIALMGGSGSGQHTKICNQILVAGNMIGAVESLLYAYKARLDQNKVIDVIGSGAASSWTINNLGRRIVSNDFEPGFYIKHFIKDMSIAIKEAQKMKLELPGLSQVKRFYDLAVEQNLENKGTQALYCILSKLCNKN